MPPAEAFYNAVFATLGFRQVYRDVPLFSSSSSSPSGAQPPAKVCGWGENEADEPFTLFESDKVRKGEREGRREGSKETRWED